MLRSALEACYLSMNANESFIPELNLTHMLAALRCWQVIQAPFMILECIQQTLRLFSSVLYGQCALHCNLSAC